MEWLGFDASLPRVLIHAAGNPVWSSSERTVLEMSFCRLQSDSWSHRVRWPREINVQMLEKRTTEKRNQAEGREVNQESSSNRQAALQGEGGGASRSKGRVASSVQCCRGQEEGIR